MDYGLVEKTARGAPVTGSFMFSRQLNLADSYEEKCLSDHG